MCSYDIIKLKVIFLLQAFLQQCASFSIIVTLKRIWYKLDYFQHFFQNLVNFLLYLFLCKYVVDSFNP